MQNYLVDDDEDFDEEINDNEEKSVDDMENDNVD